MLLMPFISYMDVNVSDRHTTFYLSSLTRVTLSSPSSSSLSFIQSQLQWKNNISQAMTTWLLWIICLERCEATFYSHHNRYLDTVDQ